MNRRERRATIKKNKVDRNSTQTETVAALYEVGLRQMQAGRYLDAQLCCQQALATSPNHADTLHLMGLLAIHAKQYDLAVEWISRTYTHGVWPSCCAASMCRDP